MTRPDSYGWQDDLCCPRCGSRDTGVLVLEQSYPGLINGVVVPTAWTQTGRAWCRTCESEFEYESEVCDDSTS